MIELSFTPGTVIPAENKNGWTFTVIDNNGFAWVDEEEHGRSFSKEADAKLAMRRFCGVSDDGAKVL